MCVRSCQRKKLAFHCRNFGFPSCPRSPASLRGLQPLFLRKLLRTLSIYFVTSLATYHVRVVSNSGPFHTSVFILSFWGRLFLSISAPFCLEWTIRSPAHIHECGFTRSYVFTKRVYNCHKLIELHTKNLYIWLYVGYTSIRKRSFVFTNLQQI